MLVTAFVDLEKAYDTVWRDLLLVNLHRWGVSGRLKLHVVTVWSREALSHVSVRRSVCTLISRRVHVLPQPAPVLLLSGQPMRVDDAPRYLGVQFNGRLD